MEYEQFEQSLIDDYSLTDSELTFESFLLKKCYNDHKKMVLMAGDLGEAFSKIGDFQSFIRSVKKFIPESKLKGSPDFAGLDND